MLLSPCPNCRHVDAHDGGGIGVCRHANCGCDNTTTTTPWLESASQSASTDMFLPHDPLCGWGNDNHPECFPVADCGTCALIAKVRANTVERVIGHVPHGALCSCGADVNNFRLHLLAVAEGLDR